MGPRGFGSGLKRRPVPLGFILTEYGLERCHGDPFRDQSGGLGMGWLAWLHLID